MENKPSFYSILTANVRYDERLSDSEKILFSEITALSNKYGYCTATNNYFSELYNVSKRTISTRISNLKKLGYLYIQTELEGKQIKSRKVYPMTNPSYPMERNFNTPMERNFVPPIEKNFAGNNTSINNTSINNTSILDGQEIKNSVKSNYVTDNKSEKDNDSVPVEEVLLLLQNEYTTQVTPIKLESVIPEIEKIGKNATDVIFLAIDYAKNKTNNLNYLVKIINNWADEGISTVEQAKEKINGKQKKNNNSWIDDELNTFGGDA